MRQVRTDARGGEVVEVSGRHYTSVGDGAYVRPLPPGASRGDADVTTPHPDDALRKLGWRLAWVFLCVPFACMVWAFLQVYAEMMSA